MKTLDEAAKLTGITRHGDGLNLHFSPIPNWYGCITGFKCPICNNHISWQWDWGDNKPMITVNAPQIPPTIQGALLVAYGHRFIVLTCSSCNNTMQAENFD